MIGYTTEAQKAADIARLEGEKSEIEAALADAKAAKVEPDLSEAERAFFEAYTANNVRAGLIAAYPALHAALGNAPAVPWPNRDWLVDVVNEIGRNAQERQSAFIVLERLYEWQQANAAPEPTEAEDFAMAQKLMAEHGFYGDPSVQLVVAAIHAERRRARGGV